MYRLVQMNEGTKLIKLAFIKLRKPYKFSSKFISFGLLGTVFINVTNIGFAQSPSFKKYIDSYKIDTKNQIRSLDEISSLENKMTSNEALEFVYDHDSSRLFCSEEIVDLMTEKVSGVTRNLYLPEKCALYQNEKYFFNGVLFISLPRPKGLY